MAKSFEAATEKMEHKAENMAVQVPVGYTLKRESKTKRSSIIMRPSTFEKLEDLAAAKGIPRNELLNQIIEDYLKDK